jgi:hypothetical protein
MDSWDWKAIAAVYAAILSTVVYLERFLSRRPIAILSFEGTSYNGYIFIRVNNPDKYPLIIRGITLNKRLHDIDGCYLVNRNDKNKYDKSLPNGTPIVIDPGDTIVIRIVGGKIDDAVNLRIYWRRHGNFIYPSFPLLITRSYEQIMELSKAQG